MTRPRQSLLSLFDPLASLQDPSTPPRNDSPGSESDKENENPPPRTDLTLTTFFNRTYKPHHSALKPIRRRLIDVGDVTVDNIDPWASDEESDETPVPDLDGLDDNENDTLTFRKMAEAATPKWTATKASTFKTPSPTAPRTPLSELTFDQDATPMAKPNKRPPLSLRSKLAQVESPQLQITVSHASPQRRPAEIARESNPGEPTGTSPGLSVSANPLVNSVSSIHLPSASVSGPHILDTVFTPSSSISDEPLFSSNMIAHGRLRPHPPSTSSLDTSRYSIDLQSSFQLHLNDESNFDLLNDKVSFFGLSKNGNSSYLDEDPSFDMSFGDSLPTQQIEEAEHCPTEAPIESPPLQHERVVFKAMVQEVEVKKKTHIDRNSVESKPNHINKPAISPKSTHSSPSGLPAEKPQALEAVTPKHPRAVPVAPPPVVGLRIVKRSQLATQAGQKQTVTKAVASPRLAPRQSMLSLNRSPAPAAGKKVLDPPPVRRSTAQSTSNLLGRVKPTNGEPPKPSVTRSTSGASSRTTGSGPRRVLVTEEPERRATRPDTSTSGTANASSVQGGPRRVPVSERPSIPKGSLSGTLNKQPSSTSSIPKAQSNRINIGSSLPQPVSRSSRLPAPSSTLRSTGLPGRDTNRGIPLRRII
ncbi:hypothetical protein D9611_005731 [Ephemerocybe angulata]|uniref:Uncharacterized protein n=1 Tax=Ephemerocybe angulata TaxID=980116 RepID=A0A8H5BHM3_9AGAR|nr:hypothetical protein D9611_005731 [Tulosesus angulatus]